MRTFAVPSKKSVDADTRRQRAARRAGDRAPCGALPARVGHSLTLDSAMQIQYAIQGLRCFLMQTPLLFVSFFYVGGALGLLMQELMARNLISEEAATGLVGKSVGALLILVAPVWGILRSVWLLARKGRRGESLLALFLSLPFIFVVHGTVVRAPALSVPALLSNKLVNTDNLRRPVAALPPGASRRLHAR